MADEATTDEAVDVDNRPAFRYIGFEPVDFPSLGVHGVSHGDVFRTHHPVSSPLIEHEDGTPTYVPYVAEAVEPIAESTFEDLTKAELLDLAAGLDLHGRSQMTKPELIDALREAAQVTPEEQAAAEVASQTEGAAGADTSTDTNEE